MRIQTASVPFPFRLSGKGWEKYTQRKKIFREGKKIFSFYISPYEEGKISRVQNGFWAAFFPAQKTGRKASRKEAFSYLSGSSTAANPPFRTRRRGSVSADEIPSTDCFR